MKLTPRESMLALTTLAVVLYGGGLLFAWPRIDNWKRLSREQAQVEAQINKEVAIIKEERLTGRWGKELAELKKGMPAQKGNVDWLRIINDMARSHSVTIGKQTPEEPKQVGELYELSIVYSEVQGTHSDMVHFLFDMQAGAAMIDVRELLVKPIPGSMGVMRERASMRIYCAYIKE
ncbi:MAG: hypothetical protein C0404_06230 [Verrucomicrobia bacterium]|nr:hypothetical protein [Verrucomicrobiota bacterium]